jgi:ABC-2 type transport system permease protein
MNKIGIIMKREYLTRVKNKTFLLSTFLLPIVMMLFIFGTAFFAATSKDKRKRIAVVNDPGYFRQHIGKDSSRIAFVFETAVDSGNFAAHGYDGVLNLSGDSAGRQYTLYSTRPFGIETKEGIEERLAKAYEQNLLLLKGIRKEVLDSISRQAGNSFTIDNRVPSEKGTSEKVNAKLSYGVGFGSGILIYITMFVFGAMVMRGVMEEKTNRIAEVIVSSVKPFQLMMGKILGIALVGLTQFALWGILIIGLSTVVSAVLPGEVVQQAGEANKTMSAAGGDAMALANNLADLKHAIGQVNWWLVIPCFIFYFLGGYLFYASLFAAVGSVINEDPQEAQSLMLPITMPIIFAFIIMSSNLDSPDSPAMVWASIVPFTSPIVMMGRIPAGVPAYQLISSVLLLVAGFLFTTWLAGKIYRTGILMYGKKASWKEMLKWAFRKY